VPSYACCAAACLCFRRTLLSSIRLRAAVFFVRRSLVCPWYADVVHYSVNPNSSPLHGTCQPSLHRCLPYGQLPNHSSSGSITRVCPVRHQCGAKRLVVYNSTSRLIMHGIADSVQSMPRSPSQCSAKQLVLPSTPRVIVLHGIGLSTSTQQLPRLPSCLWNSVQSSSWDSDSVQSSRRLDTCLLHAPSCIMGIRSTAAAALLLACLRWCRRLLSCQQQLCTRFVKINARFFGPNPSCTCRLRPHKSLRFLFPLPPTCILSVSGCLLACVAAICPIS
jgi:hypothetical protein